MAKNVKKRDSKHNRDYKPEDILFPEQKITESDLESEMQNSYIDYAMSVIVGRALPDVRDGLKPVHRRILYAMFEDNLTHSNQYRKCATAVGDVLGRYHPHGDASVYDALVRMGQDFSMRMPLIDGHGNFGDIDGNPPAAYRYTEARMSAIADEMLRDINKETVDFLPNFDETRKEPQVLPSRFPNLLVNGSSGIAVGMATNIPPHNLGEVIDAAVCLLQEPEADLNRLMEFVQGPDFPTRGTILGRRGIRAAYATGRGHITVRARAEFEEYGKDKRTRIIVNELPYQVNKSQLVKNIADLVRNKRIEGVSDLRDESDRNGMRIVIELKRDANPQVVLNHLYSQTQLQVTFGVIMLALVNRQTQPKVLTLKEVLQEYLLHQEEVLRRRTEYDLRKARERAHLLEGLLLAQDNIDEVIHIIRTAYDDAKEKLMARFGFDDVQAQAIMDMRLKALQGLDREKLQAEFDELQERIQYYISLLEDEEKLKGVLKDELLELKEKYATPRLTEIEDVEDEIDVEDLIEEKTCVFTLTHSGYVKRTPAEEYRAQGRGGRGIKGMATHEDDFVETIFTGSTHDKLLFFTSQGRCYCVKGYQVPEAGRTAKGTAIINVLKQLQPEEKINCLLHVGELDEEGIFLLFSTRNGTVKRTPLSAIRNIHSGGIRVLNLREGDELIDVHLTRGESRVMLVTHEGKAVCFDENEVPSTGRDAMGVRGIRLREGDFVVGAVNVNEGGSVFTVTENGCGKRTEAAEYSVTHRGGMGVINYKITDKTGPVCGARLVQGDEDVILIANNGTLLRTRVGLVGVKGRATQGVRLMRLEEGVKVFAFALTEAEEDEPADTAAPEELPEELPEE